MILNDFGQGITYHEEDGKIVLQYHNNDVEPILKANHEQRVLEGRFTKKGDMHQTFRVPTEIMLRIMVETGLDFFNPDHWREIKAHLKRPEYAAFRTTEARI